MVRMPGTHTCRPQVMVEYTPEEGARITAERVRLTCSTESPAFDSV
jgi:hypothetical protein